jgi:hypothetical protein
VGLLSDYPFAIAAFHIQSVDFDEILGDVLHGSYFLSCPFRCTYYTRF